MKNNSTKAQKKVYIKKNWYFCFKYSKNMRYNITGIKIQTNCTFRIRFEIVKN